LECLKGRDHLEDWRRWEDNIKMNVRITYVTCTKKMRNAHNILLEKPEGEAAFKTKGVDVTIL
jgi:hypothetical protein